MGDDSNNSNQKRPPAAAFGDDSITGTRCQDQREAHGMVPATHDGCPGWWSGFEDDESIGFVCACNCHNDYAGWPGWEANQNRI